MLAAVLLVLFLSLAGIPPLVGFWAKFNFFAAVLGVGCGHRCRSLSLVALAIAFSAVSLYYYLQVLKRAYVMPATDESPIRAHPVTTGGAGRHRRRRPRARLLPGAAAELDRELLQIAESPVKHRRTETPQKPRLTIGGGWYPTPFFGLNGLLSMACTSDHFLYPIDNKRLKIQIIETKGN